MWFHYIGSAARMKRNVTLISGEDGETVGVKALVLKTLGLFESMQPKKFYIDRPLPSQIKLPTLKDDADDKGKTSNCMTTS